MVVIPSLWDVFNYTALEAMTVGVPCVVSSGAGISYLCHDGYDALVVPPGEATSLSAAMLRLAGDRSLAERIGSNARAMVIREFSPQEVVAERIAAYECAIAFHDRRPKVPYADATVTAWTDAMASGMTQAVNAAITGAPWRDLTRSLVARVGRRLTRRASHR